MTTSKKKIQIDRVQTGIRIEKKILKVLKGVADYKDLTLGQMLELILLHAFENRPCFSKEGYEAINSLKKIHDVHYNAHDYLKFIESNEKTGG